MISKDIASRIYVVWKSSLVSQDFGRPRRDLILHSKLVWRLIFSTSRIGAFGWIYEFCLRPCRLSLGGRDNNVDIFSVFSQRVRRIRAEPIGGVFFSLASDSAVYLVGGLLMGLGSVVLVPLYTRALGPREFGVYALLDITVLLVVTV